MCLPTGGRRVLPASLRGGRREISSTCRKTGDMMKGAFKDRDIGGRMSFISKFKKQAVLRWMGVG